MIFADDKRKAVLIRGLETGGGGGHVSLEPVHLPRKSLSEKHPKQG